MKTYKVKYAWYKNAKTVIKQVIIKACSLEQLNSLLIANGIYFTKEIEQC